MSNLTDKFRLEQLQYLHLSGESSLSFLRNLLMVSSIVLPILSLSSPNLSLKGKADFLSHSSSHLDLGSGSYLSPGKTKIRAIKGAKKMDSLSHPPALHTGAVQAHRANWRLPQSWIHSVTAGNAHHEVAAMKTQIFVYDNGTSSNAQHIRTCWALLEKHQRHKQPWLQKSCSGRAQGTSGRAPECRTFHCWLSCGISGESLGVLHTGINTQKQYQNTARCA